MKTTVKTMAIALAARVASAMPAALAVSERRTEVRSDGRYSSAARAMPTSSWRCSPWERSRTSTRVLCPSQTLSAAARARARVR